MMDNGVGSIKVPHPSPHRKRVALLALWFGIAAAPLAWDAQLLSSVSIAGHACFPKATPLSQPMEGGLPSLLIAVNLAAIAVALCGAVVAWSSWRKTRQERPGSVHDLLDVGDGRTRFMAMCGVMVSGLFVIALAFGTVTLTLVPLCGR